jgi:hypothetical protein
MSKDFYYCNTGKCPHSKKCERHVRNHYFEPETVIPVMTVEFYGKDCQMFVKLKEVVG